MTQEEKELLLKDLCGRLPYGVICNTPKGDGHLNSINQTLFGVEYCINIYPTKRDYFNNRENNIMPYLRPMSSMTEEEDKEYNKQIDIDLNRIAEQIKEQCDTRTFCPENALPPQYNHIDWLIKKMFDYRGLIEKGLALEAPEGMYKMK